MFAGNLQGTNVEKYFSVVTFIMATISHKIKTLHTSMKDKLRVYHIPDNDAVVPSCVDFYVHALGFNC